MNLARALSRLLILALLPAAAGCRGCQGGGAAAPSPSPSSISSPSPEPKPQPLGWVDLPGGACSMGHDGGDDDESPAHRVKVPPFRMNRSEVTVAQYRPCVAAGRCPAPGAGRGCNWDRAGKADHPVNCLTWEQARAFCAWAGGRLPSEAEWEFAARGGAEGRRYPWGEEPADCARVVMPDDRGPGCGEDSTAPVCSRPHGNSLHGLCDLAGNVWEWVADCWHAGYKGAPADGSAWSGQCKGSGRMVVRGSSFLNGTPDNTRAASRDSSPAAEAYFSIGFRCAR